jgi:hypothetical protein
MEVDTDGAPSETFAGTFCNPDCRTAFLDDPRQFVGDGRRHEPSNAGCCG